MSRFDPNQAFELSDYNPAWPAMAAVEMDRILAQVGALAVELSHIGSTSVPGLCAKPTIDLLLAVESFAPADEYAALLAPLGYTRQPHANERDRIFFWKGAPRTYHLHVVEYATWEHQRHLLFRDTLRARPEIAREYAAIKRDLAARFYDNRPAYTEGKTAFITAVMERAAAEIGRTPGAADGS